MRKVAIMTGGENPSGVGTADQHCPGPADRQSSLVKLGSWNAAANRTGRRRRTLAHSATFGSFLILLLLLFARSRTDLTMREPPDWRPIRVHAEIAFGRGDLYKAKHLYSQAARIASWREDWRGLVAAACGMSKIETERGPYSGAHILLLRALAAAELRRSRAGMSAVALALAAIGEDKTAAMASARARADWPEEEESSLVEARGCRQPYGPR